MRTGGQLPDRAFKFARQGIVDATSVMYAGKVKNSRLYIW